MACWAVPYDRVHPHAWLDTTVEGEAQAFTAREDDDHRRSDRNKEAILGDA